MLTAREAVMCLEAIICLVSSDKLEHELDNDTQISLEMNVEQSRENFIALFSVLSDEDRKSFIEKLKSMSTTLEE